MTNSRPVVITDSLELIRNLRARNSSHTPFILYVSELDESEEREAGLRAGADECVGDASPTRRCPHASPLLVASPSSKPFCASRSSRTASSRPRMSSRASPADASSANTSHARSSAPRAMVARSR